MNTPELSGVSAAAAIALCPGQPLLSVEVTNRLILRHGLNRVLARAVVHDAVAASVSLSQDDELALVAAHVQSLGIQSQAELDPWLTAQHWSRDDLSAISTLAERLRRWSHWRFEQDVEVRFLDRKLDLDRVVYSLLQVSERELAEELHQRVRSGEMEFAEVVRQFSLGVERETDGFMGPVALSALPPELGSRLRVGSEGQLWPPFVSNERWLVVRLERQLPAQLDQATREQLLHDLFATWVDSQVEALLRGESLSAVTQPEMETEP